MISQLPMVGIIVFNHNLLLTRVRLMSTCAGGRLFNDDEFVRTNRN
jgi:hypothetical protein